MHSNSSSKAKRHAPAPKQSGFLAPGYGGLYEKIPCVCLTVTATGTILDANRWARDSLGYSAEELTGASVFSLFCPEERERLHSVLRGGEQGEDFQQLTKAGETWRVKLTLDVLQTVDCTPILLLICERVTEPNPLEASVRNAQSQVRLLMDAFPGKVSYVDAQCRYQLASKRYQEWSLTAIADIVGKPVREFMSPQQYQAIAPYVEFALSGQSVQYEFDATFNDGQQRYLLVDHVPHFSHTGQVLGFFVFCQEITARKQAEIALQQFNEALETRVNERTQALEQALRERQRAEAELRRALAKEQEFSELKTRFISTTSHEFRTPLTTILASSQMLERYRHKLDAIKQQTHLHRIQSAAERMTQMLDEVLTLSQAEAGKLAFYPAPLDLPQFCRELVEELQLTGGEEPRPIALTHAPSPHSAILDAKLLRHILVNLLSNALKYSPPDSPVRFSVCGQDTQAIFIIQDWGIGIPPRDREHLFESFHRATNVGASQGTGLGLAIVKQCVDLHRGEITVESALGEGTTFSVLLPYGNPNIA